MGFREQLLKAGVTDFLGSNKSVTKITEPVTKIEPAVTKRRGRPSIGDEPMTAAERMRKMRSKQPKL